MMTTDDDNADWPAKVNPGNILGFYILDRDGNPVEEPDVMKWGEWMARAYETGEHWVARTELPGAVVSTIFEGIDRNHSRALGLDEPLILFETMCFDDAMNSLPIYGGDDEETSLFGRYATRAEALEGHEAIVTELRLKLKVPP